MTGRKTFNVEDLKTHVNKRLRESTCTPAERLAMACVLEHVLFQTDNYNGYSHLATQCDDNGQLVSTGDDSRRRYW
jgi:hypothetical protein